MLSLSRQPLHPQISRHLEKLKHLHRTRMVGALATKGGTAMRMAGALVMMSLQKTHRLPRMQDLRQHQRPSQSPTGPGAPGSIAPVAVNISLSGPNKSMPAPAPTAGVVGGGGRGYGY